MRTSRLDEPYTVVDLLSCGVEKRPLSSVVGILSTGGSYGSYASCSWLIAPSNATNVTLEFSSFATEECCDYVYVYDGPDASGARLASLSGAGLPPPITSVSGSMFVLLESDGTSSREGFTATFRADNAPPGAVAVEEPSSYVCVPAEAKIYLSPACRSCIMATIAGVCGEACVKEQMHIMAEPDFGMPSASPCLPALRSRLMSEQAGRLQIALTSGEPFGLTCGGVSDLFFTSTATSLDSQPMHYVGLDTGYHLCRVTRRNSLTCGSSRGRRTERRGRRAKVSFGST
jgi:hypothetical protein